MPLSPGKSRATFEHNVSEMMHAGHPQDQALAAAFRMKRQNRDVGGTVKPPSWIVRNEARSMTHAGPIMSAVAGRTDHHPMSVSAGSYVFPADHVSSLGQGNSMAGMASLNHMFKMGPYGAPGGAIKHGPGATRPPAVRGLRAKGGAADDDNVGQPVPINAAGGEFVVPPEKIMEWWSGNGFVGDLKDAHEALDQWVVDNRKKHQKTLAKLPGPAKS